jgi:DNA primase
VSVVSFSEACDRIKSGLDIVEVIRRHVILKKSGRSYTGKCPFHNDKSPSMNVSQEKGIFKCFACGVGGDALTFLMKLENRSFGEVIRDLAQEQGIDIAHEGRNPVAEAAHAAQKDTKQKILELNEATGTWFQEQLATLGAPYFSNRYPELETRQALAERFRLGLAPEGWDHLATFLKANFDFVQANPTLLEDAGLAGRRDHGQGHYDRFRNRLVIPIQDEQGRVVAFGARALSDEDKPKYLNSPETVVYKKNQVLYGLYQAKESIRQTRTAVVMEGYFDVISAHMAGITEAVGSCGTAMTDNHLKLLTRFGAERVLLAFDSDEAGLKAALSATQLIEPYLKGAALSVHVLLIPDGKDPDDFIRRQGGEAFRAVMAQAKPYLAFQCDMAIRNLDTRDPEGRIEAASRITPVLAGIERPTTREEYLHMYAELIGLSQEALALEVRRYEQAHSPQPARTWGNSQNTGRKRAISGGAPTSLKSNSLSGPDTVPGFPARQSLQNTNRQNPALQSNLPPRQEAAEKNLLRLMLYNMDSFSLMTRILDTTTRSLFSDPIHLEILDGLLAIAGETPTTTETALDAETAMMSPMGTLIEKMNHLYSDKSTVMNSLIELAMSADTFADSLSLGELTGTALNDRLTALTTQHIEQLTHCQRRNALQALKTNAARNGEDTVALTYSFREQLAEIALQPLKTSSS